MKHTIAKRLKYPYKINEERTTTWAEIFLIWGMPKTLAGLVAWSVTDQRHFQKGQLECFHFSQCYWHELLTIKADHGALKRIVPVYCLRCFGPMFAEEQGNKKSCLALDLKIHNGLPLPTPLQRTLLSLGFNRANADLTYGDFYFAARHWQHKKPRSFKYLLAWISVKIG